jgi:hypothetical protein
VKEDHNDTVANRRVDKSDDDEAKKSPVKHPQSFWPNANTVSSSIFRSSETR